MEKTLEKKAHVVGIDAIPPSILCKAVCKSCMASNRRDWRRLDGRCDVVTPWNAEDESRWEKGQVSCWVTTWTLKFIAEKRCKYYLEHIVSSEA
jgi:hypothetical protein